VQNKCEQISELAIEVRPGYTIRTTEKGLLLFPYRLLQIKDITKDGRIDPSDVRTVSLPKVSDRYLVQVGDVVLSGRGQRNQAAVYKGGFEELVPGAQLWVIRVRPDRMLPAYLAWYLNQPKAQQYLSGETHGTYIPMIHKEAVMNLEVPVPSLEVQRKIVAVHELALREQGALEKLKAKRAKLVSALCGQAAEKLSTGNKL
jgi:hypothetical protein